MQTTPKHGLPYSEGTDPAKQHPASVDKPRTQLLDNLLPLPGGLRFAYGKVAHNTVNGWNFVDVAFPAGRFTTAPVVILTRTISSAEGYPAVGIGAVNTAGITINVFHSAAVTTDITWLAVGT